MNMTIELVCASGVSRIAFNVSRGTRRKGNNWLARVKGERWAEAEY
jgi:hypothetical protein